MLGLALASTISSSVIPIVGGLLQGSLYRTQGRLNAASSLLQGNAEAFSYRYNAEENRREARNIHKLTEDQIYAYDLNSAAAIADIQFEYAKAGIPMSGSALTNIKSNITQKNLQRGLIQEAGSEDELNLMIAATNNEYLANLSLVNARFSADTARSAGRLQGNLSQNLGILSGVAGGLSGISSGYASGAFGGGR